MEISLFKKTLLPVVILFLVFALSACRDSEDKTSLPRLGSRAFDFTCRDLQGRTWNLETVRGKVLLLRFWADWCPYCRFEMPVIEKFYRLLGPEGFEVLAVNVKQSAPVAQAFIGQMDLTFPVPLDPEGRMAERYGVYAIPTNFLIDRRGVIREILIGEVFREEKVLRDILLEYFPSLKKERATESQGAP